MSTRYSNRIPTVYSAFNMCIPRCVKIDCENRFCSGAHSRPDSPPSRLSSHPQKSLPPVGIVPGFPREPPVEK